MCHDSDSYKRFHDAVLPSKDIMISEGFSSFAVEDFYDSFMEQLEKLDPQNDANNSKISAEQNGKPSNGTCSEQNDDKLGKIIMLYDPVSRYLILVCNLCNRNFVNLIQYYNSL